MAASISENEKNSIYSSKESRSPKPTSPVNLRSGSLGRVLDGMSRLGLLGRRNPLVMGHVGLGRSQPVLGQNHCLGSCCSFRPLNSRRSFTLLGSIRSTGLLLVGKLLLVQDVLLGGLDLLLGDQNLRRSLLGRGNGGGDLRRRWTMLPAGVSKRKENNRKASLLRTSMLRYPPEFIISLSISAPFKKL